MFYDWSYILLLVALVLSMAASAGVNSTFSKFSQVQNRRGMTGAQAARLMLDANGLQDVAIRAQQGNLTDNYNPKDRTLNLSQSVYNTPSVSAVSVACHEAGHAIQHAYGYAPLNIRTAIVPVVSFASRLTWILVIAGIFMMSAGSQELGVIGSMVFDIGVLAFASVVIFQLITLPVEFDASNRALDQMEALQILGTDESPAARKVLKAAAMTYIAGAAVSVVNLLRILSMRGRR